MAEIHDVNSTQYHPMDFTLDGISDCYKFNDICEGSVPQAFAVFFESDDFEDTIRNAVSIGGDSDTIAALAVVGAYYGMPDALREKALSYIDEGMKGSVNGVSSGMLLILAIVLMIVVKMLDAKEREARENRSEWKDRKPAGVPPVTPPVSAKSAAPVAPSVPTKAAAPAKQKVAAYASAEETEKMKMCMTKHTEFMAMGYSEKAKVAVLDLSDCDFRKIDCRNICCGADHVQEVILSDTILDPKCAVYCMDNCGKRSSEGTFVDDNGIICWWGDGNTRSHAYENRVPAMKPFAEGTDRERRAYLGLGEHVKLTIVAHGKGPNLHAAGDPPEEFDIGNGVLYKYLGHREHVRVPAGVTHIAMDAFTRSTYKEETIEVFEGPAALPPMLRAPEEVYNDAPTKKVVKREIKHGLGFICVVDLPDSVEVISRNAFYECTNLRYIRLPGNLRLISDDAFYGCVSLKEIHVSAATEISSEAFRGTKTRIIRVPKKEA